MIKEYRAEHSYALLLDAGNTLWGQSDLAAKSQGKVIVEAMNLMGYDAMALGETDLQLGEDVLRQRISDARFPVLSADVVVESTGKLLAQPYALLSVGNRKVGVIGLTGSGNIAGLLEQPQSPASTTPMPAPSPLSGPASPAAQAASQSQPAAKHVIGSLDVIDPATALTRYVKELQAQTNIIIVLSNLGWEANLRLAETVPGLDLIISAGPGQVVIDPLQVPGTGTLVCQANVYPQAHPGQLLADVKMHIDGAGIVTEYSGGATALGSEFVDDEQVRKLLNDYQLQP